MQNKVMAKKRDNERNIKKKRGNDGQEEKLEKTNAKREKWGERMFR